MSAFEDIPGCVGILCNFWNRGCLREHPLESWTQRGVCVCVCACIHTTIGAAAEDSRFSFSYLICGSEQHVHISDSKLRN